jgi:hypothetical protein
VPRPNPTLACAEGVWSFWRPSTLRRDDNDEVLCGTRAQPILDLFLAEAAGATRRVPELLAAVSRRAEIELDELTPFFDQLVAGGLLIAELEPPYSCRRPLRFIAERMREADATAPWLAEIEAVEEEVDTLPRLAPGERKAAMDRLEERLFALPRARGLKRDDLFRVDSTTEIEVSLPARLRSEIEVPLRRCVRLFAGLYRTVTGRRWWATCPSRPGRRERFSRSPRGAPVRSRPAATARCSTRCSAPASPWRVSPIYTAGRGRSSRWRARSAGVGSPSRGRERSSPR